MLPAMLAGGRISGNSHTSMCPNPVLLRSPTGDVVVLATDGLYDNVFDDEICQVCTDTLRSLAVGNPGGLNYSAMEAEIVAGAVARTAHAYAQNPHQRTPWSVAASETGLPWARFFTKGGGKMDDVTVVVGFVVPDNGR